VKVYIQIKVSIYTNFDLKIKTIEQERIDFLIPILRKASVRWKYRLIAKEKAKRKSQSDNKKLKWEYQDAIDGTWHPGTNIELDHKVPISTCLDFNTFIEKLFCDESNYQVLSKENHAKKTAEESTLRSKKRNKNEKNNK